jgi:dTDP-4-amino-4,6-dideoxygalactose transaminase
MSYIVKQREENYYTYRENLTSEIWLPVLEETQNVISNMGYPIITKNKREVYKRLSKNKIECRPLVAGSMGLQPAWSNLYGESPMVNADIVDKYGMYVPNHQDLTSKDIKRVCSIINEETQ